jgi:(2Fe-2S) ferredoxin
MTSKTRFQILVCDGPSCGLCLDSEALLDHIHTRIAATPSLEGRVFAINLTCFGRCDDGPNMLVRPLAEGEDPEQEPEIEAIEQVRGLYLGMDQARVDRVLDEHCEGGQPIAEWAEAY